MAKGAETTPVRSESDNDSGGQQQSGQKDGGGGLKSYFVSLDLAVQCTS